ncbi:MAG: DUF2764 family protein [Thermodesulfobacteriota bacterium]
MKYYFLIGFLPELRRDLRQLKFTLADLIGESVNIAPADWREIELVLLYGDVFVVEKLRGGETVSPSYFVHGMAFWQEQIKSLKEGPAFLLEYLRSVESEAWGPKAVDLLYSAYYRHVLSTSRNRFLKEYIQLEWDVRNVMAALRARRKGLDPGAHVSGEGDLVAGLSLSRAEDFGLAVHHPWVESLVSATDPHAISEALENILWDYLDDVLGYNAFSLEAVLAYSLKLRILERRLAQSRERGLALVHRLEGR